MQKRRGAIELQLRRFIARHGKVHAAKFFSHVMLMRLHLLRRQRKRENKHGQQGAGD
jgi:hypothetical protein